ncbi:hypothetical protein CCACVL1_30445 [Corchorus capsularis]|uniref:Replication protein A 70 kDa DNA-binding subunit B/D first OB fold domain-containing protein n=1 Tax=Corchorus capsularis TaxID=210143 RepID=A0A1R3FX24_COCAP|nr:hypothetical protein CCACVL1_30445 [Corchorus capsularis]
MVKHRRSEIRQTPTVGVAEANKNRSRRRSGVPSRAAFGPRVAAIDDAANQSPLNSSIAVNTEIDDDSHPHSSNLPTNSINMPSTSIQISELGVLQDVVMRDVVEANRSPHPLHGAAQYSGACATPTLHTLHDVDVGSTFLSTEASPAIVSSQVVQIARHRRIAFLGADEKGDVIHVQIKDIHAPKYKEKLIEGAVFQLNRFTVQKPKGKNISTMNEVLILFQSNTEVKLLPDNTGAYPEYVLQFHDREVLTPYFNTDQYMTDAVGALYSITNITEVKLTRYDRTAKKFECVIIEPSGAQMSITLWESCFEQFDREEILSLQPAPVVLFQGMLPKTYNEIPYLASCSGTRILFNPQIAEISGNERLLYAAIRKETPILTVIPSNFAENPASNSSMQSNTEQPQSTANEGVLAELIPRETREKLQKRKEQNADEGNSQETPILTAIANNLAENPASDSETQSNTEQPQSTANEGVLAELIPRKTRGKLQKRKKQNADEGSSQDNIEHEA